MATGRSTTVLEPITNEAMPLRHNRPIPRVIKARSRTKQTARFHFEATNLTDAERKERQLRRMEKQNEEARKRISFRPDNKVYFASSKTEKESKNTLAVSLMTSSLVGPMHVTQKVFKSV